MVRSKAARKPYVAPTLIHIAHALSNETTLGTNVVPRNVTDALVEFAHLASVTVLTHGVVASDDFRSAIDHVAMRHFGRRRAEKEFATAMARVADVRDRNALEAAHGHVLELGELAHYYAGLACGITLLELGRK